MVSDADGLAARFRSEHVANAFVSAYEQALGYWPVPVSLDLAGDYGTTRVHVCGPAGQAPLVLLHGGGCTSTIWYANVGALAQHRRVYAVDQMGDAGMSFAAGRPVRGVDDLVGWLDGVLDGLGIEAAALCGHSYGAWIALCYAVANPSRVTRLALLDPTSCFAGLSLRYRMHALAVFARPSATRMRRVLEWEAEPALLDPLSVTLASLGGGEFRGSKLVMPRPPSNEGLRALDVPTLLLLAERSKAHHIGRVRTTAERLLPQVVTVILPGASHHTLPATDPDPLTEALDAFLG